MTLCKCGHTEEDHIDGACLKILDNEEYCDCEDFRPFQDCTIGKNTKVWHFVNLYGCTIGDNCMIGSYVEIQSDVVIGNNTRVQSHSFICSKVKIGNNCFIGHDVVFINDLYPPQGKEKWKETIIEDNVSIGSNATILPVRIGRNSVIGAGAVVTKDVPENCTVVGNPARVVKKK